MEYLFLIPAKFAIRLLSTPMFSEGAIVVKTFETARTNVVLGICSRSDEDKDYCAFMAVVETLKAMNS